MKESDKNKPQWPRTLEELRAALTRELTALAEATDPLEALRVVDSVRYFVNLRECSHVDNKLNQSLPWRMGTCGVVPSVWKVSVGSFLTRIGGHRYRAPGVGSFLTCIGGHRYRAPDAYGLFVHGVLCGKRYRLSE